MGFRALQNTGDHRYWSPKLIATSPLSCRMLGVLGFRAAKVKSKSLQVSKKFHSACTAHLGLHLEAPMFESIAFFGVIIVITTGS